jgi:hypothetical protein
MYGHQLQLVFWNPCGISVSDVYVPLAHGTAIIGYYVIFMKTLRKKDLEV